MGSCRRELLDQVIALNERHLKRFLCEYVSYHHEDRTHLGLHKETPGRRTHSLPSGGISYICILAATDGHLLPRRGIFVQITHGLQMRAEG